MTDNTVNELLYFRYKDMLSENDYVDLIVKYVEEYVLIVNKQLYIQLPVSKLYRLTAIKPDPYAIELAVKNMLHHAIDTTFQSLSLDNRIKFKKQCCQIDNSDYSIFQMKYPTGNIIKKAITRLKHKQKYIMLNNFMNEIHFLDGYLDTVTNTFYKRLNTDKHVTEFVCKKFKKSDHYNVSVTFAD